MIPLCLVFMLNGKGKQPSAEKVMDNRTQTPLMDDDFGHPSHKPPSPGEMLAEVEGNRESQKRREIKRINCSPKSNCKSRGCG